MAKKATNNKKTVETLTHDADKRKNIPTAVGQSVEVLLSEVDGEDGVYLREEEAINA